MFEPKSLFLIQGYFHPKKNYHYAMEHNLCFQLLLSETLFQEHLAKRTQNLQVHVWTIDDPTEMNRLIDLGVDGIMTDKPSLLKEILTERKLWN